MINNEVKNETLKPQQQLMERLVHHFNTLLVDNESILNAYDYQNHQACDYIAQFERRVKWMGLHLSDCYHDSGIGNNNCYKILIRSVDSDGFVIDKQVAEFYYCYGVFGGVYASLTDLATGEKYAVGHAR